MRRPQSYRRRGVAILWFSILGIILALTLALSIDIAHIGRATGELHNTADASALAGALFVRQNQMDARLKAQEIAALSDVVHQSIPLDLNEGNNPDGDIVLGIWDRDARTFTPDTSDPNAVSVVGWRDNAHGNPLPLFTAPFVRLFPNPNPAAVNSQIARRAIAMSAGGTGAGIIVLDPEGECAFRMNGNIDLVLIACTAAEDEGGEFGCEQAAENGEAAIQVDSDSSCAACTDGTAVHIEAPAMNIVGPDPGICSAGTPTLDIPEINTEMPYIPDPLAGIPEPSIPGANLGQIKGETGYFPPGYYAGGIDQQGNNTLCLGPEPYVCPPPPGFVPDFSTDEPAIYYLEGAGLENNGNAELYAYQVMFFVKEGHVQLNGTGAQVIIPADIDLGGQYGGISIFQARDNTAEAEMTGNEDMILQGTYYFPVAKLDLGGTGIAVGNQLISWQLQIHGTGEWTINYDGRNPAPGVEVFLVY